MKFREMLLIIVIIFSLINIQYINATSHQLNYVYRFSAEGYVYVTVLVDNVVDEYIIYVPVEESIVEESLVIVDEFNELLPAELADSYLLLIYNVNNSKKVVINYVIKVADIKGGYVNAIISPGGPSKIYLPRSSALLYFNGSADVSITDNTIVLTYEDGGKYLISYIPPNFIGDLTTTSTNVTVATDSLPQTWIYFLLPYLYYLVPLGVSVIGVSLIYYLRRRRKAEESIEAPAEYDVTTLRSEVDERDVEILKAALTKELTISGLARELGLSKSVAWRRIRKLSNLKLVTTTDVNGKIYIKVTRLGKEIVEKSDKKIQ
ncbi:MAG: winged helix-turn-helix domain-containing protein [Sulfolobales archaeon]